jgi:hypothetical protein
VSDYYSIKKREVKKFICYLLLNFWADIVFWDIIIISPIPCILILIAVVACISLLVAHLLDIKDHEGATT